MHGCGISTHRTKASLSELLMPHAPQVFDNIILATDSYKVRTAWFFARENAGCRAEVRPRRG